MDVTPRELRDVEIREAFRGYNRDEVNDLLERAAAAIEALNERTRVLTERLASGQTDAGRSAARPRTCCTAPCCSRSARPTRRSPRRKRRRASMIEDAETRSRRMLADAAIEARRTTESERRRLEQEITELQRRREALSTDVDGLEHFESEYRTRLDERDGGRPPRDRARPPDDPRPFDVGSRRAARRSAAPTRPTPRPTTGSRRWSVDVAQRPRRHAAPARRSGCVDPNETDGADVRGLLDEKPKPLVGSAATGDVAAQPISDAAQAAASETTAAPAPRRRRGADAKAPEAPATIDLFGAEQAAVAIESAALDDDSFFASLRDAVRDDAPLGPRDAVGAHVLRSGRSKDSPTFREAFKRRR